MKNRVSSNTVSGYDTLSEAFKETIAKEGEWLELKANNDFLTQNLFKEIKLSNSIGNLFNRIEQCPVLKYSNHEIIGLVADMLRKTDMSMLSIEADIKDNSCYCAYRINEQAQFIQVTSKNLV